MNVKNLSLSLIFALLSAAASAETLTVPGSANPWLAGMPAGSTASADTAPAQSPVLFNLPASGGYLTFTATGGTAQGPFYTLVGPDGNSFYGHAYGDENGIAASLLPGMGLVGVFLSDDQPNLSPTPSALNYSLIGKEFTSFSAQLKQPFFIGDGQNSSGVTQMFYVPTSASRLYLGTADGYGWYNNIGELTVNVSAVPTPASVMTMLFGLGVLSLVRRGRRTKDSIELN